MEFLKSILRWFAASLAAVGLACLPASVRQGLWTDELFSLIVARERPEIMLKLLWQVHPPYYDQPPLYFLILHPFTWIPHNALALRIPSLVFAAAALAVWCALARRRGLGVLVTGAMLTALVLHPTVRFQATNIRMYTLFLLQVMIATAGVESLLHSGGRRRFGFAMVALSIGAMFYTSYHGMMMALGIGGLGAGCAVVAARRRVPDAEASAMPGMLLGGAAATGCLLGAGWFLPMIRMRSWFTGGAGEFIAPFGRQLADLAVALAGSPWAGIVLIPGWLLFAILGRNRGMLLGLFSGTALLPFLLSVALTPREHFISDRYFLYLLPWIYLLAALGWEAAASHFLRASKGAPLAAALILLAPAIAHDHKMRTTLFKPMPDWRAAAWILEHNAAPTEGILTGGFMSGDAIEFALADPSRFTFHHKVYDLKPFLKAARRGDVVWHVNAGPLPEPFVRIVRDFFPYSTSFEGRHRARIEIHSKKPFALPWGGGSDFNPPQQKQTGGSGEPPAAANP